MSSGREIRFSTSFQSKKLLTLKCYKMSVETELAVRIVVESNAFDDNDSHYDDNDDVQGRRRGCDRLKPENSTLLRSGEGRGEHFAERIDMTLFKIYFLSYLSRMFIVHLRIRDTLG